VLGSGGDGDADRASGRAGRDRLRAGHADREQVIEALKDAYVQGGRHLARQGLYKRVVQV
jgi:hypothetical protein